MKALILTAALALAATPALADSITVGLWDGANPGAGIVPILSSADGSQAMLTYINGTPNNFGPHFGGDVTTLVLSPDASGSVFREASFDDIHSDGTPDTIRLYFNFQGVTSSSLNVTFPTIFAAGNGSNEIVPPGWTIAEQVYVCANGNTFCDDDINPTGTLIGSQVWTSAGTLSTSFDAIVPAQTFNMDLVFTIVSSDIRPFGDASGAILAQPDADPVPGPIVGAGFPGLVASMFGLWGFWRRRKTSVSLNG
jgi:hypothetical protein